MFLLEEKENANIFRDLVRKMFYVGTFNLDLLVDDWKNFSRSLFHQYAETEVIGGRPTISRTNIYKRLLGVSTFKNLDSSFRSFQILGHLLSTRQFPFMGKRCEEKSLKRFEEVVTSLHEVKASHLSRMGEAAFYIGRKCRLYHVPHNVGHFSINSSGDYEFSTSEGGNALGVRTLMIEVLGRRSDVVEEMTPWGYVQHNTDLEIWRYLYRETPILEGSFLEPLTSGFPKEQPGRLRGLDEVIGRQLMYAAWKKSVRVPTVRCSTVAEMGNKARIVTVGPAWLQILQAPLAHTLKHMMWNHPSVFSSFHRQDQAWMAVIMISKSKLTNFDEVLSSDLKDATNAQGVTLTRHLVRQFLRGYGLRPNPYVDFVIDLIGPREIVLPTGRRILSRRGIMMGEPMAKPCLTLLNLCVEYCAWRKYKVKYDRANLHRRLFHIGGDDHLVIGPRPYLNYMTKFHLLSGSQIEGGVHGTSRIAVRYVERVLFIGNFSKRKPHDPKNYPESMIVETIKVRILERGYLLPIIKDNKNVAIGKSSTISACLKWMPKHPLWPEWHKQMIRGLFVSRMGSWLPNLRKHPKCFNSIMLPKFFGGYGLAMSDLEEYTAYTKASRPLQWIIAAVCDDHPQWREGIRELSRLNRNLSKRGDTKCLKFEQDIIEQLMMVLNDRLSWKQLEEKFPSPHGPRGTVAEAQRAGYMSIRRFADEATRGVIFQNLVSEPHKISNFNTQPYRKTMGIVWEKLEALGIDKCSRILDSDEYRSTKTKVNVDFYFNTQEITCADIGFWDPDNPETETWEFIDVSFEKLYTMNLPTLRIPDRFLFHSKNEELYYGESPELDTVPTEPET
uniref:RNA-dependent RNA polymerase-like protein n=1 Tax=Matryoshka RNA virus 1 TaxID=2683728 RepID=A0A650FZ91_9VIRU|nr:RNA-dependent RNA polymerase-like protein [Matryoshka RNA virus 1]